MRIRCKSALKIIYSHFVYFFVCIVQSIIIDSSNIITYNGQPYSFMPNTGYYTLAEDFVNNNFTILAYYEENVLTKLSVSIHNGVKYVLLSGGSVSKK